MPHPTRAAADRGETGHHREGFTLVELVYVVLVIGILAGILLPRIDVRRARVDGAVLRAGALVTQAQRRALLRQHDVRILFDVDRNVMILHEDADNDGAIEASEWRETVEVGEGAGFGSGGAPAIAGAPGGPVGFPVDATEDLPILTFHRSGSASAGGAFYIAARPGSDPATARAVRVERATGATSCWSHRNGAWEDRC